MTERTFDYSLRIDELRCRTTDWLKARRSGLVAEQRRLHVEELAVVAVLDERGAIDDSVAAADGVSVRSVRETVETARALGDLPHLAAAAHAGALSDEQLAPAARLADAESDREWAVRAPNVAPVDLARLARTARTPSMDEARARRAARDLSWWWRKDAGMLMFRGQLADVDGQVFESVINQMIDKMKPAKGQPWETRARRGADALVELVSNYADVHAKTGPLPHLVVEVPLVGPAEVGGIPLPDEMVQALRTRADIEPVLVDADGAPVLVGSTKATGISAKTARQVLLRDGHCRIPGCTRCEGLEVHHLVPKSWGGSDEPINLAAICRGGGNDHHPWLVPQGPYLLLGNPNQVDGLRLIHRDDLPALAALAAAEASAHQAA